MHARGGAQVSFFWLKRVRDLTPVIQGLLGVRSVWCDTKTEQNAQKFVLWAGYLLEQRWVFLRVGSCEMVGGDGWGHRQGVRVAWREEGWVRCAGKLSVVVV
jgi:hypothetical protein